MSLSNLCFEQHQQDQARLRKLLLLGLLGSVGVHAIALGLSQINPLVKSEEVALIELIVTEPLIKPLEPDLPDPTQPAELSSETNNPAAALAPAAPSPKAAIVTAPRPVAVAEPAIPEPVEPEPLAATEVESALKVPEEEATPEADLPPEAVDTEETTAEAEPVEPELATAPEDSSQFDRLRDFLQRRREAESEVATTTPVDGNADPAGPSASDSAGTAATTAARTGTSETANPSGGNGQGQGSRTVACQNCVRPSYPQSALAAGAEGQPMVSVDINPDGSVRSVTLTRSSGNPAIDQAAIQAARNSRFQPVAGGASVPIEYDLTIEGSRRNRDARRRGERQAVELPSEPTPATATTEPSSELTTTPIPPIEVAEPAAAPTTPASSELERTEPAAVETEPVQSEPAEAESIAPKPAPEPAPEPAPVSPPPLQSSPAPSPPAPSASPPPTPATPTAPPPAPVAPAAPTPPPAVESSQPDAPTAE